MVLQTEPVSIDDGDSARDALQVGQLELLVGVRECGWLDVKSGPYQVDEPRGAAELLKDVSGFANAGGGLLLVGYRTRRDGHGEVVEAVAPVLKGLVDVDRYLKLIRDRVHPFVRGLSVRWIDVEDGKGVLVIDVPAQCEADKPFVVPGPDGTKAIPSVGVPIRQNDSTHWLPRHEIQRLLAAGWSAASGLTAEMLRRIVADSVSNATLSVAATLKHTIQVGEGEPGNRAAFVEAYRRAGGEARLGRPTTRVVGEGPGFVQHFEGEDGEEHAVLCALPGASAVAVTGSVWNALSTLPGRPVRGVQAAGFPLVRPGASAAELIDYVGEDAVVVDLDGGSWGRGQLVRDGASCQWRWQPSTRLLMEASLSRHMPSVGPADVTVRAVAALPWNTSQDGWEITKGGRQRLLTALSRAEVSNAAALLSRWRGAMITPPEWERPCGNNAHQSGSIAHYRCVLWAPDGQAAVTTTARLHLPTGRQSSITTCVELQINLVPWRSVLTSLGVATDVDLRLTAREVVEFWAAAWDAATMVAPIAVVDDPPRIPLLTAPRVELQIKVNDRYDSAPDRRLSLPDVLDLSVFGEPTGDLSQEGAVTIIAPIGYDRAHRLVWTAKALTRLARAWTFVDAEEQDLVQALR
ncbi:MAG: hypothetical protein ACRDUW_02060 [Pseudonocardiaceae bacterium]